MLVPVHNPRHDRVRVGASADDEEEDEEEGLEVEERRLKNNTSKGRVSDQASETVLLLCLPRALASSLWKARRLMHRHWHHHHHHLTYHLESFSLPTLTELQPAVANLENPLNQRI